MYTDAFQRSVLQYRCTPDHDTKFRRPISDLIRILCGRYRSHYSWPQTLQAGKEARSNCQMKAVECWARPLLPLIIDVTVWLQNQTGLHPRQWDKTDRVMWSWFASSFCLWSVWMALAGWHCTTGNSSEVLPPCSPTHQLSVFQWPPGCVLPPSSSRTLPLVFPLPGPEPQFHCTHFIGMSWSLRSLPNRPRYLQKHLPQLQTLYLPFTAVPEWAPTRYKSKDPHPPPPKKLMVPYGPQQAISYKAWVIDVPKRKNMTRV